MRPARTGISSAMGNGVPWITPITRKERDMHVTRSRMDWRWRKRRKSIAAVLMMAIAGFGGSANAVEFDASLKEPSMKSAADLQPAARTFIAKYREVHAATPALLITSGSLSRQQFDMTWQLRRAVDEGRPLEE